MDETKFADVTLAKFDQEALASLHLKMRGLRQHLSGSECNARQLEPESPPKPNNSERKTRHKMRRRHKHGRLLSCVVFFALLLKQTRPIIRSSAAEAAVRELSGCTHYQCAPCIKSALGFFLDVMAQIKSY